MGVNKTIGNLRVNETLSETNDMVCEQKGVRRTAEADPSF